MQIPPTFAPTATSVYQPTAEALVSSRRGEAAEETGTATTSAASGGSNLPWGVVSLLVVAAIIWYQLKRRR
ncbi:MAG: hypothetical protein D6784_12475 [Chloroflexi bacterium]|nr:MAG: hypothetical protein D6784_12475 [Chloroflexota bacterium]